MHSLLEKRDGRNARKTKWICLSVCKAGETQKCLENQPGELFYCIFYFNFMFLYISGHIWRFYT